MIMQRQPMPAGNMLVSNRSVRSTALNLKKHGQIAYRTARLIVVCVVGATLMLAGIVMLVTPGPGWAAIAAALAVLSIEFAWARRWLAEVKKRSKQAVSMVRSRNGSNQQNRSTSDQDAASAKPSSPQRTDQD